MERKGRVNIRKILADPDLRRKLMVSTIQATQAREGIETSEAQADRAYYVVTEGERAAFFDLSRFEGSKKEDDKRHETFVRALRGEVDDVRFDVVRRDFSAIQGAPIAFSRLGFVAHLFREAPALEPSIGIVRQGKATGDDPRWVRDFWEIEKNRGWVPFAKGGEFSRFYSDVRLVLDWKPEHREALKASGNGLPSLELYFKPGLTWPLAASVLNVRILPDGCIFGHKGPAVFPKDESDTWSLLAILNADMALCFGKALTSWEKMGGRWEVGVVKRFPIPELPEQKKDLLASLSKQIHDAKASWDEGNETCTRFRIPWILRQDLILPEENIPARLDRLAAFEAGQNAHIQTLYARLNDEVYRLYGIPDETRAAIEETLGDRPPEVIWPQMEGKSDAQKRMEHVWRLLSHAVKRVVTADPDGVVPFLSVSNETGVLDRVLDELARLFPDLDPNRIEVEIVNELKQKVPGYRKVSSILQWLDQIYFAYHVSLYRKRPVIWHVASNQGRNDPAFGVLVEYHKFDRDRLAKLRSGYLLGTMQMFRREAGLASQEGRTDDRLEWQARIEEVEELDHRLARIQEGACEGSEGGDRDFRILTPWKSPLNRPKGWDPDLDDGVAVNIAPFERAGVLKKAKVL